MAHKLNLMLLALWLATTAGCPPPEREKTVHVQGKLTIGGQPLPADATANISFMPMSVGQAGSSSASVVDGQYNATSVPAGKVLVTFTVMQPTGEIKPFAEGARAQMDMRSLVPQDKSNGVEIEVKADNPNLNFDL